MPLFIPKPIQYDANTHDGTEASARELVKWMENCDDTVMPKIELMDADEPPYETNPYVVVYETERGYDVVVQGSWILWRADGTFMQYDEQEFNSIFDPVPEATNA